MSVKRGSRVMNDTGNFATHMRELTEVFTDPEMGADETIVRILRIRTVASTDAVNMRVSESREVYGTANTMIYTLSILSKGNTSKLQMIQNGTLLDMYNESRKVLQYQKMTGLGPLGDLAQQSK